MLLRMEEHTPAMATGSYPVWPVNPSWWPDAMTQDNGHISEPQLNTVARISRCCAFRRATASVLIGMRSLMNSGCALDRLNRAQRSEPVITEKSLRCLFFLSTREPSYGTYWVHHDDILTTPTRFPWCCLGPLPKAHHIENIGRMGRNCFSPIKEVCHDPITQNLLGRYARCHDGARSGPYAAHIPRPPLWTRVPGQNPLSARGPCTPFFQSPIIAMDASGDVVGSIMKRLVIR